MSKTKKGKVVSYNKWGYIFLLPFIIVFIIFQLVPLVNTIRYSFYTYFRTGLDWVGPTWNNFQNYAKIFGNADIWNYAWNTLVMWIMGFIPQIIVSLVLGSWFSDQRLRLKFSGFFKTVIYLPNLIMASAFAMLFFTLFSDTGPVNQILTATILDKPFTFFDSIWATRILVAFMNFLMWFGNTTILLMAGIMGIDGSLFEAAEVDGATPTQVFFRITLPLLKPILVYVMITSLIGGLQMFDVPQILTDGEGRPMRTSMTMIMYLNKHLFNRNYGLAGALSVFLFIITGALSVVVYKFNTSED